MFDESFNPESLGALFENKRCYRYLTPRSLCYPGTPAEECLTLIALLSSLSVALTGQASHIADWQGAS
jgi:hypothetical protein